MGPKLGSKAMLIGVFGVVCGGAGVLVGHAATSGTPEIDRANATFQLSGNLKSAGCVGEDNTDYVTYKGAWAGGESQQVPDATDYTLSGPVTIKGIKWTINSVTGRGILTGNIALTDPAGAAVYSGKITLVSQGRPSTTAAVPARGWISANFKQADDTVAPPNDDYLIANVEFTLSTTSATGQFGDLNTSLGLPDFSAVTNLAPSPADGTC